VEDLTNIIKIVISNESILKATFIDVERGESTSGRSPPSVPKKNATTASCGETTSIERSVAETTAEAPAATLKCVLKFAILLVHYGNKFMRAS